MGVADKRGVTHGSGRGLNFAARFARNEHLHSLNPRIAPASYPEKSEIRV